MTTTQRLRAVTLALLTLTAAAVGGIALTGTVAASTTHYIHDAPLEVAGDGSASWTAGGASLAAEDTDSTLGDEARLVVPADDVGVATLGDLDSMTWSVIGGAGYAPHVDVILDTDGDGSADDALVFEYAKVDPADCDDAVDYPTGDFNTFADKGIVDDGAHAWLASGAPGPCGDPAFINGSLADWKAGAVHPNVSASTDVLRLEVEVDNWISDPSTATIDGVTVNGAAYHDQVRDGVEAAADGDTVALTDGTFEVNAAVSVATPNVTVTAASGAAPTVLSTVDGFQGALQLDAPGTSVSDLEVIVDAGVGNPVAVLLRADDTTAEGLTVDQRPDSFNAAIQVIGAYDGVRIEANDVTGGAIGLGEANVTARNNTVADVKAEGIFSAHGAGQALVLEGNTVTNYDLAGGDVAAVKLIEEPATLDGAAGDRKAQAKAAIQANTIDSIEIGGTVYQLVSTTETVVETVVDHQHHHHAGGGGGGTQVVERTVTVQAPSPTPEVRTEVVERTVIEERTVTVVQPSPTPRVETVIREVTQTPGQPGFGLAVAIVALLAAALLALRRRD